MEKTVHFQKTTFLKSIFKKTSFRKYSKLFFLLTSKYWKFSSKLPNCYLDNVPTMTILVREICLINGFILNL